MELVISSPDEQRTLKVAWLEIETPAGNFVIERGHAPTLLTLMPHQTIDIRLQNGKQETLQAGSGIVHVTRAKTTIILGD